MRNWGDEDGMFWQQPVVVGRSSAQGRAPRPRKIPPPPEGYKLPEQFIRFGDSRYISIDLETHDPDLTTKGPGWKRDAYIVGVAVRTSDGHGDYYPIRHANGPNMDPEQCHRWLRDEFKRMAPGSQVTGTNLLYDAEGLQTEAGAKFEQVKWRPVDWAEPLLDETQHKYGLKYIAQRRLGTGKVTDELEELYGDDYITHFEDVHPGHARAYGLGDVDLPFEIIKQQQKDLESEGLTSLFETECGLLPILLYMRTTGCPVDIPAAERFNQTLDERVAEELGSIRNIAGMEVNPNAGDNIARAFDKLQLPYPVTGKGNPSFVQSWLENHSHPIAQHIISARKYQKFKGTFVESYILNNHIEGRVYAQFHPLRGNDGGTVSGRFSSSNPNLQNIPTRDEVLGPLCRALFIPPPGQLWWSLDYSQMEYRLLVHYALLAKCRGADKAAAMYWQNPNTDFHQVVADLIGWEGKQGRKRAKNINFGFVYGMGVYLLAANIGLIDSMGNPLPEAYQIFEQYHSNAPFIKQVYDMASSRAADMGFVRTILGRKRRFNLFEPWGYWVPDPANEGAWLRTNQRPGRNAERPPALPYDTAREFYGTDNLKRAYTHKALNTVLQGSNADFMKKAMVEIWEAGCFGPGKPLSLFLTVHDELDGAMDPTPEGHEALEFVRHTMESTIALKVPVIVSGATGQNWSEAH